MTGPIQRVPFGLLLLSLGLATAVAAEPGASDPCDTIVAVEIRGNQRMSADAVRFDLQIRKGDTWDDRKVEREFQRFWDRGLFSDLRFFKRCDSDGAVLVVEVKERPTLLSVTYDKNGVAGQQQIEDHFKERNFQISVGAPLDRKKIAKAEGLIRELLGTKGYLDAVVRGELEEVSPTARALHFRIKPGGRTRISAIDFVGNKAFSDRTLRRQLKLTAPQKWWWPWSSKSLYHPLKFSQDVNNVIDFYKNRGYLDADVKPAITEFKSKRSLHAEARARRKADRAAKRAAKERERKQKAGEDVEPEKVQTPDLGPIEKKSVALTVPVTEGPVYRLGEVKFNGNAVLSSDRLRMLVPIINGGVLSDGALEAGLANIRRAYGRKGYVYAAVTRRFERKAEQSVADVAIEIDEDKAYKVRHIDFIGNTLTQDEVLRREMNVFEGELLDRAQLDISMRKLQQLQFWQPAGEPELEPIPGTGLVDVKVHGEEQSRNEVQVGGGYSELEGAFFLASYATRNFLGRGDSLDLYAQVGGRANRASIRFTEPWFMGKPYVFSFSIFRRSLDFGRATNASGAQQRLNQTSTGGSVSIGKRVRDFYLAQIEYSYQNITADTVDLSQSFDTTTTRLATVTPSFSYHSVNNPLRPTLGLDYRIIPQISAQLFGGDVTYIKPRFEISWYHPLGAKLFFASHLETSWVHALGIKRRAGYVDGVPRFDRFFLGGDTIGPRIFETRTISPTKFVAQVDGRGNLVGPPVLAFVGGSKMLLTQFELGIPIGKTATFAGFLDAGGTYLEGQNIGRDGVRVSGGVEFRVFLPVFQAPIRLIYGWPLKKEDGDRVSNFQFSIGLPF